MLKRARQWLRNVQNELRRREIVRVATRLYASPSSADYDLGPEKRAQAALAAAREIVRGTT